MSVTLERPTEFEQIFNHVGPATVSQGRRWVGASLTQCGCSIPDDTGENLAVIVSELLTNVCLHAPGAAMITIRIWPHELELVVADQCRDSIHRGHGPAHEDEHHRGLDLIEGLCGRRLIERDATCAASGFVKELVVTLALRGGAR